MLTILRGMGQIMLQQSALVGLFFLVGIFVASPKMGIGALVGVIVATFSARIWHYNKEEIKQGLYGYNGALVGIALTFFFRLTPYLLMWVIAIAILSTWIMHFMQRRKMRPYTFPFVLSTWIALFFIHSSGILTSIIPEVFPRNFINYLSGISMGFGQVMFQASIASGIIFFIGILIHSRKAALFGLMGSVLGLVLAAGLGAPAELITIGIFGYNAVLSAIAFAKDEKFALMSALIAIILSVVIMNGFIGFGLPALTAPFVFATWITLLVQFLYKKITNERRDFKVL